MYTANTYGSTRFITGQSGVSYLIKTPKGKTLCKVSQPIITNDSMIAEYKSIIKVIEKAIDLRIPQMKIYTDCRGIALAIQGLEKINSRHVEQFYKIVELLNEHKNIYIEWVPRKKNKVADRLARAAMNTGLSRSTENKELSDNMQKNRIKYIVRKNKYLMIKCKNCKERKSVDQFPPKHNHQSLRNCYYCMSIISKINTYEGMV